MSIQPDHRAVAIGDGQPPLNDVEKEYKKLLSNKKADELVVYATDIYEDEYKSEVIEAFLLTRASPEDIEAVIHVPAGVVRVYQHLFFDINAFKDELDVESYVHSYPNEFGKDLKISAVTLGVEFLRYRFNRGRNDIDITSALRTMIENAYILSKAMKLNPLDSNAAKEARQWMQAAIKGMQAYVTVKPATERNDDDFRIVLENIDKTTNEELSAVISKDKIIH